MTRLITLNRPAAPVVLLTATLRWPLSARLAMVLAQAGFEVHAHCPLIHPLRSLRCVRSAQKYSEMATLAGLRRSIREVKPDLVIPCDDRAAQDLFNLHAEGGAEALVIARSLGAPNACALAAARTQAMDLAQSCGVRVPRTLRIASAAQLQAEWRARGEAPAVLKTDFSWGGEGVWMVNDEQEALAAFAKAHAPVTLRKALSLWWLHGDASAWQRWRQNQQAEVSLQDRIEGSPANRAVACWQGEVLAGVSVEALHTQRERGPATVVRVLEHAEMSEATRRIVAHLGISGLWGFDFMLDAVTGTASLIEINPRATPCASLRFGARPAIAEALRAACLEQAPALPPARAGQVAALFPDELLRDAASPYLRDGSLDVPWEEPELLRECLGAPWAERGLLARLRASLRQPQAPATRPPAPLAAGTTSVVMLRPKLAAGTDTLPPLITSVDAAASETQH